MYQNLAPYVYEQKNEVFLMLFQFASYFSPSYVFFPHVLNYVFISVHVCIYLCAVGR